MAALSFKGRFVDLILEGKKNQTIRNVRKYPIKPGETLYLYYGMRTKYCKKLKEVICTQIFVITITKSYIRLRTSENVKGFKIDTQPDLDIFAQGDGFKDWEEMKRWWTLTHALPWVGQLIHWKEKT
jgi:hypothetical protein